METLRPQRLLETRSLSQILPKGTEGGKEFARIVDLLLFHDARRNGRNLNLFSDASGDFIGLDSFAGDVFRRGRSIGYQYKFYPSPLSQDHRTAIKESILKYTKARNRKTKILKKWILVTPDDFTESTQKTDGGDFSWFVGLKDELNLNFEIEHWGHRQLQALFIETRSLCLFYYPDLVINGTDSRRTIESIRKPYDENLLHLYRRIEFVGMSVYKPEATRGVPIEDIYIPLSTVPNATSWDDETTPRINPLDFLGIGRKQVILGDPGSGKSTLLRFLALVGQSSALQKRCNAKSDSRLPVLIILRKYATELKKTPNLPLFDFIVQSVKADFSLNDARQEFFEYFLECGQAILLFDGLDELGSSDLKKTVRDRIQSFAIAYPGNTFVVTSRIVGYDAAFGFDEKEFAHYRVGRLRKPEITQFVEDWYRARIENEKERNENAADLVRVLTEDAHVAIQDLARNPLLLTIIALVHRIDAVLPDERVVLYQKCTETLLNTWHTWKFRETDVQKRGKIERRNRQRMEAIAHWMQTRPRANAGNPRAIVKNTELIDFLAQYIRKNETSGNDEDALDLAEDFIEFVRARAGLLIEVGDKQFSFVHLTFQEYLTAAWLKTKCEKAGVENVWRSLTTCMHDSAWHEVIRLLIASLTSDDAQEVLMKKLLQSAKQKQICESLCLLNAGLLLDGVEAAAARRAAILRLLLESAANAKELGQLRKLIAAVRSCDMHDNAAQTCLSTLLKQSWSTSNKDSKRLAKLITILLAGRSFEQVNQLLNRKQKLNRDEDLLFSIIGEIKQKKSTVSSALVERFTPVAFYEVTVSPIDNLIGASLPFAFACIDPDAAIDMLFRLAGFTFNWLQVQESGPFIDFYTNIVALSRSRAINDSAELFWKESDEMALNHVRNRSRHRNLEPDVSRYRVLKSALTRALRLRPTVKKNRSADIIRPIKMRAGVLASRHAQILFQKLGIPNKMGPGIGIDLRLHRNLPIFMNRENLANHEANSESSSFWDLNLQNEDFRKVYAITLSRLLQIEPKLHVTEIIERAFLPNLPNFMPCTTFHHFDEVQQAFKAGNALTKDVSIAALFLLIDSVLWMTNGFEKPEESRFNELADMTRTSQEVRLKFAHCIRDLAYGRQDRELDLVEMIKKPDSKMRHLLEEIFWVESNKKT
jgi:hypothetical protein